MLKRIYMPITVVIYFLFLLSGRSISSIVAIITAIIIPSAHCLIHSSKFITYLYINPLFDIFIIMVIPIINITAIKIIMASSILKTSPIWDNNLTIFLSAIGSLSALTNLKEALIIVNLIIGDIHIPSITIIPTTPVAFFNILVHPKTVSTESPNAFPTTGTKLETTAFVVLAVTPSTLLDKLPSIDKTPTKSVTTTPKNQTILDLKNLDNLSTWILSDMLDMIPSAVPISKIGITKFWIILLINTIEPSIIGCTTETDIILPSWCK